MTENLVGIIYIIVALILAGVVSFITTPLAKALAHKIGAIDFPKDERRMHKVPIPRMGGLAIFFGFIVSTLVFVDISTEVQGILLGSVVIVVLGILDDVLTLPAWIKFIVQVFAAGIAVLHGVQIEFISSEFIFGDELFLLLGWLSIPITLFWIVLITNAVNLIDGLDGLAVGVSAISSITLVVVTLLNADISINIALIMASLAGGCVGFIPFNRYPAKIFMGDTGSTFLGYILGTVSVLGLFKFNLVITYAVPFLIIGLPIFDAVSSIIRRLLKGQNPMKPDRGHVHHKLIDMGFNQKQAVAILYSITMILGLAAVFLTAGGITRIILIIVSVCATGVVAYKLTKMGIQRHHETQQDQSEKNKVDIQCHRETERKQPPD